MTDQRTRVASAHVDAVLAAHQPAPGEETPQCVMCGTPGESPVPWPCTTHEHAARARAALTAALAELDAVIAADPDHGGHYPDCHLDHATCLAARVRAHLTRKETTMPNPTTVRESDPELLELLGDAGRRWGPLGVAIAAAGLTDRGELIRRLTYAARYRRQEDPDDVGALLDEVRRLRDQHAKVAGELADATMTMWHLEPGDRSDMPLAKRITTRVAELQAEQDAARRDGAADALELFAAEHPLCSGHHRAQLNAWAAEVRTGGRTIPTTVAEGDHHA